MSDTFTRTVTCSLADSQRKVFLTRDCKRLARLYGGTFGSQVDPFSADKANTFGELHAQYRVRYPVARVLAAVTALRRRKARR